MVKSLLNSKERLGSLLVLLFSVCYLRAAHELPSAPVGSSTTFAPSTLPVGLATAAIIFSLFQIALSFRGSDDQTVSDAVGGFRWKPASLLVIAMVAYALMFDVLGFAIASVLFLVSGFLILGERQIARGIIVAIVLVGFLWLVLTQAFGFYLDEGMLVRSLTGGGQ